MLYEPIEILAVSKHISMFKIKITVNVDICKFYFIQHENNYDNYLYSGKHD